MAQDFFYIKVKLEVNRPLSEEEIEELVQEMDHRYNSHLPGVSITDASIEETSLDYEMTKPV
jgi:hypothetical protein